jgi:hypothetical protein
LINGREPTSPGTQSHRRRRLATSVAVGLLALCLLSCITSLQSESAAQPSSASSADQEDHDAINVSLTWDEWQDLIVVLMHVRNDMSVTLQFAGEVLQPHIATEAVSTMNRLSALQKKLDIAAMDSSENLPDDELEAILTEQLQRTQGFFELQIALLEARYEAGAESVIDEAP